MINLFANWPWPFVGHDSEQPFCKVVIISTTTSKFCKLTVNNLFQIDESP